ncbi:MAG TPA: 50S ribosomal protein L11 methyltransferase [Candidatus Limnocylindria bacterium]|nr:50S ribosomal protein L11 methyltransferase [Candidatus Limnocylindria bacterium]
MRWLELTVESDVEAVEAVSEIFGRLGRGAAVRPTRLLRDPNDELAAREDPTAPYLVTAHIPDDAASADAIDTIERALWHLQAFGLRPVGELRVTLVDDADWLEGWKSGYVLQRIGRVVIVPSWLDEPLAEGEVAIRLDPGMAFGTGLHPTTRGCLQLLQKLAPMPTTLLDVGTGSGILALAALQLGAERAVCIDTDSIAVGATRANADVNGLGDRVEVRLGTLPPAPVGKPFPLVLANLVAALLIELAAPLAAHTEPGGTLLASGIIEPRADEVTDALAAAGFVERSRLDDGEWVSLRLERAA